MRMKFPRWVMVERHTSPVAAGDLGRLLAAATSIIERHGKQFSPILARLERELTSMRPPGEVVSSNRGPVSSRQSGR